MMEKLNAGQPRRRHAIHANTSRHVAGKERGAGLP